MSKAHASQPPVCLSLPEDIEPGIQRMVLNTKQLYPNSEEQHQFETRLREFLKVDTASEVITYHDGMLCYLTESVIPVRTNSRPPLLLLFGNPTPDSVRHKCFFAGEKGGREHRFWPVLAKAGVIAFKKTDEDANILRTRALFDLDYESPSRIGLAVRYSMPSPASDPQWSGVAGLRRLFGARALREIAECEKKRVDGLIMGFLSDNPAGSVVAFQKDAYLGVKDSGSPERTISRERQWYAVEARCACSNVKLFRLPPTRYMLAPWYVSLLREVGELCRRK